MKLLRHQKSSRFCAAVLEEASRSASLLSGPLTCKCPPAIRHQQRKKPPNWNVNSNFWHARDIWESRAASREKCKNQRVREVRSVCVCVKAMENWKRMGDVIEGQIKWKSVWWRRRRRGSNGSQKVSCQMGGRVRSSDGGGRKKDGGRTAARRSSSGILLLFLRRWWTGWNTAGATSRNDLMNELLRPKPPPSLLLCLILANMAAPRAPEAASGGRKLLWSTGNRRKPHSHHDMFT